MSEYKKIIEETVNSIGMKDIDKIIDGLLTESSRLDSSLRQRVNAALEKAGFDGNGRWSRIGQALTDAHVVMGRFGIEPAEVANSHHLRQPKGALRMDIAFSNPDDAFSPDEISNSVLSFNWEDLGGGRYEVVAYLS